MRMYTIIISLILRFYVLVMARKLSMLKRAHLHMNVLQRISAWENRVQRMAKKEMRESNECIIFLLRTDSDLGLDEEGQRFFINMRDRYEVSLAFLKT